MAENLGRDKHDLSCKCAWKAGIQLDSQDYFIRQISAFLMIKWKQVRYLRLSISIPQTELSIFKKDSSPHKYNSQFYKNKYLTMNIRCRPIPNLLLISKVIFREAGVSSLDSCQSGRNLASDCTMTVIPSWK